jgi:hypothetical protein
MGDRVAGMSPHMRVGQGAMHYVCGAPLNFYHPATRKARKIKGPVSAGPFAFQTRSLESIAYPETAVTIPHSEWVVQINMDVS